MVLEDFSLSIGNKILLEDLNISFPSGKINHLLGRNGVGKSCFAKACAGLIDYSGNIMISDGLICLIGSYSNIPRNLKFKDILKILNKNFDNSLIEHLFKLLSFDNIPDNQLIKSMSDGQKQKIKLLFYLSSDPTIIIFDEFTSALDRTSTLDIYNFFNTYLNNSRITSINITHYLSDLEYMDGNYYLFDNKTIELVEDKEEAVSRYLKGGLL